MSLFEINSRAIFNAWLNRLICDGYKCHHKLTFAISQVVIVSFKTIYDMGYNQVLPLSSAQQN